MVALECLTGVMYYIPMASLGAIVFMSVIKMFNYKVVIRMWHVNKIDLIPWAVSFFLCTFLDIQYGVGLGILVNIFILLFYSARPEHPVLVRDEKTSVYRPKTMRDNANEIYESDADGITVMRVGTSLLFPSSNNWKDTCRAEVGASLVFN